MRMLHKTRGCISGFSCCWVDVCPCACGRAPVLQGGWQNLLLARTLLDAPWYNPIDHVHRVACPVLFRCGTQDSICEPAYVQRAAALMQGRAVLYERDVGHIEAHKTGWEPEAVAPVVWFLQKHLLLLQAGGDDDGVVGAPLPPALPKAAARGPARALRSSGGEDDEEVVDDGSLAGQLAGRAQAS